MGGQTKDLIADGFNWPLGLAMDGTGELYVADGAFSYLLRAGQARRVAGHFFSPGYPGYARGVASAGPGEFIIATGSGTIARYWPAKQESAVLASGFDQLYGVAVTASGAIVFAHLNSMVLASSERHKCHYPQGLGRGAWAGYGSGIHAGAWNPSLLPRPHAPGPCAKSVGLS